jgi:hypothetical protein
MKKIVGFVLLIIIFFSAPLKADFYSIKNGIWEETATATCPWSKISHLSPTCSCSPTCSPGGNFIIYIKHNIVSSCTLLDFTGVATIHVLSGGSFTLNGGGTLTGTANIIVDQGGAMIINGNLSLQGNGSGLINGSLFVNGTITNSSSLGSNGLCGTGTITSSQPILPGTICQNFLLPVEYLCFKAKEHEQGELLYWETVTEKNNLKFEIEKSNDGIDFEKIGEVFSKALYSGNSENLIQYEFIDKYVNEGQFYYRLKQIDLNNNHSFSQIISVVYNSYKNLSFVIYPNPNHSEFYIEYKGISTNKKFTIQIINQSGYLVYQKEHLNSDTNQLYIKCAELLKAGSYTIRLSIDDSAHHLKMIIN